MGQTVKDLKAWLKTAGIEIRARKLLHKDHQRKEYFIYTDYRIVEGYGKRYSEFRNNMCDMFKLKREYRHRHIAYSELRGKTRTQIEASYPYEGQSAFLKPDEKRIQKIKDEVIKGACSQVV